MSVKTIFLKIKKVMSFKKMFVLLFVFLLTISIVTILWVSKNSYMCSDCYECSATKSIESIYEIDSYSKYVSIESVIIHEFDGYLYCRVSYISRDVAVFLDDGSIESTFGEEFIVEKIFVYLKDDIDKSGNVVMYFIDDLEMGYFPEFLNEYNNAITNSVFIRDFSEKELNIIVKSIN